MRELTKVILWGREDVICQGVEIFLKGHCGYEIRRVIEEDNSEALIREIQREYADVVIINPGQQPCSQQIALQLIEMYPGIKVITLDLEDSAADVYNRKKVWMEKVSDLLDLVG